jgi:hypothetical protein
MLTTAICIAVAASLYVLFILLESGRRACHLCGEKATQNAGAANGWTYYACDFCGERYREQGGRVERVSDEEWKLHAYRT